jgi:hypothetical protein
MKSPLLNIEGDKHICHVRDLPEQPQNLRRTARQTPVINQNFLTLAQSLNTVTAIVLQATIVNKTS